MANKIVNLTSVEYNSSTDRLILTLDGDTLGLGRISGGCVRASDKNDEAEYIGTSVRTDWQGLGNKRYFQVTVDNVSTAFAKTRADAHADTPASKALEKVLNIIQAEGVQLHYPLFEFSGAAKTYGAGYNVEAEIKPVSTSGLAPALAEVLIQSILDELDISILGIDYYHLPSMSYPEGAKVTLADVKGSIVTETLPLQTEAEEILANMEAEAVKNLGMQVAGKPLATAKMAGGRA